MRHDRYRIYKQHTTTMKKKEKKEEEKNFMENSTS